MACAWISCRFINPVTWHGFRQGCSKRLDFESMALQILFNDLVDLVAKIKTLSLFTLKTTLDI